MAGLVSEPEFARVEGGFVSLGATTYLFGQGGRLDIPAATFTNGGDVPWPFSLIFKRRDKRFLARFLIHDELCRQATHGELSRVLADAIFYDAMKTAPAPLWRCKVMYQAVRFWALLKTLGLRQ